MELTDSIEKLSGVGSALAKKLHSLDIFELKDLLYHFPFRYEDYSKLKKINEVKDGEVATLKGEVWSIKNTYTKFRKVLTKVIINDGDSSIEIVWFNSPWMSKSTSTGDSIQVSGKVQIKNGHVSMIAPEWEKITSSAPVHTGKLVPIYPETYGLSSKWIRSTLSKVAPVFIPKIEDPLPDDIRANLISLPEALYKIHFPESFQEVFSARARLGFDEIFEIQLATQKIRLDWKNKEKSKIWKIDQKKLKEYLDSLPFTLTNSQTKVLLEIIEDVKADHAMNRLVQGEVGSGKTVVASAIIFLAHLNNAKTYLLAPTEILAFQHFSTLKKFLEPFGIKIGIYTGSKKSSEEGSNYDVYVGTHALLTDKLNTSTLGFVIIDEQQRFGVEQRGYLRSKKGNSLAPHFLTMTATPIPRTVALTLYGDLDLSIIDELPKGRKEIKTYVVPSYKRQDAYKFIEKKVLNGDQVYIITPLIEESETLISAKAAKAEFENLSTKIFPKLKLGLLHGRLKSREKEEVINKFKAGEIQILISTSVVEVGVDVPNATIMVIEGGERFGLAQIHQLRGRVGRGEKESFCLLFSGIEDKSNISRLKFLERIENGLKLSEIDLKIRGSGEIFGKRQSGRWDLKIANLSDLELIEKARSASSKILKDDPKLDKYPKLKAKLASLGTDISPD